MVEKRTHRCSMGYKKLCNKKFEADCIMCLIEKFEKLEEILVENYHKQDEQNKLFYSRLKEMDCRIANLNKSNSKRLKEIHVLHKQIQILKEKLSQ